MSHPGKGLEQPTDVPRPKKRTRLRRASSGLPILIHFCKHHCTPSQSRKNEPKKTSPVVHYKTTTGDVFLNEPPAICAAVVTVCFPPPFPIQQNDFQRGIVRYPARCLCRLFFFPCQKSTNNASNQRKGRCPNKQPLKRMKPNADHCCFRVTIIPSQIRAV